jgi:hypothetical protein
MHFLTKKAKFLGGNRTWCREGKCTQQRCPALLEGKQADDQSDRKDLREFQSERDSEGKRSLEVVESKCVYVTTMAAAWERPDLS